MSRPGRRRADRRRCTAPPAVCAAVGWQLGTACLTGPGTATCPRCATTVAARAVAAGIVEIAVHPPADAVTCSSCGTVHARLACPGCGQPIAAADTVQSGLTFAGAEAAW